MARMAWNNGIRRAVVTPHIHLGRYDNDIRSIRQSLESFSSELRRQDIRLQVGYAAEVRITPEIVSMIERDDMPYLGTYKGSKVVLLELPHSHVPVGSDKLVRWLVDRHIKPMIAHPERNKDVIRSLDKIFPFVEMGCLLQLTAGSVAGKFGPFAKQRAQELLEKGWVNILASDAHNLDVRVPDLETGRAAAEHIVGRAASWSLVRDTPYAISRAQFEAPVTVAA